MGKSEYCVLTKSEAKKLKKCQKAILDVISDGELIGKCLSIGNFSMKNPAIEFVNNAKAGAFDDFSEDEYEKLLMRVDEFGDGKPTVECDYVCMTAGVLSSSSELLFGLSRFLEMHDVQKRWGNAHREVNGAIIGHYEGAPDDEVLEDEPIPVDEDAE